jgi:HKD family nuclease
MDNISDVSFITTSLVCIVNTNAEYYVSVAFTTSISIALIM